MPKRESHITITQRSAAQNGQYSAPTKTTSGFPSELTSFAEAGSRTSWPDCEPEPTVLTTEALGASTAVRIACGTGVARVALLPPVALMTTSTMRTIATTATLEMVTTVGDCHGGRRSRETDLAAAWLRRCFLVAGLAGYFAAVTGRLPAGLRGVD